MLAAVIVAVIAFPLIFIFAGAIADARARAGEAPFRALLGNARFEGLMSGDGGVPHYLGASLLAPDFTLPEQTGGEWTLSQHRGNVVVMNFWTVTCRPCIQEMPTIELLAEIVEPWGDVDVVAVSTDRNWAEVADLWIPMEQMMHLVLPTLRSATQSKSITKTRHSPRRGNGPAARTNTMDRRNSSTRLVAKTGRNGLLPDSCPEKHTKLRLRSPVATT